MKTLFIGNSYTFFNDLPKILEDLSRENGKDLTADSVTKGGRHLYQNLAEEDEYGEKVKSLIKTNEYDALFLQEQSFFAIVDFDKFLFGVESLKNLVSAKRTILYATWGRKSGSSKLEELGLTSEEMTDKLTEAYISAALTTNSEVSHVGKTFLKLSKSIPELELYNKDLSHPSYLGSVVAAICHYNTLFGEMPTKTDCLNIDKSYIDNLLYVISETLNEN